MSAAYVHPTSLVAADEIGEGTRIWAFSNVLEGARIGADCNIGDHCFVEGGAVLGDGVTVKNGTCVWDGVTLEDGVFVGPGSRFTNDLRPRSPRLPEVADRYASLDWVSPTLVRLLMAAEGSLPPPGALDTLRVFGSTGEAWNEAPWLWLFEEVGQSRRPIINYSGGTEIGGGILACFPGRPQKPGAFDGPIPGMAVDVRDADGQPVRESVGELTIRRPWPGMTNGFWRDDADPAQAGGNPAGGRDALAGGRG